MQEAERQLAARDRDDNADIPRHSDAAKVQVKHCGTRTSVLASDVTKWRRQRVAIECARLTIVFPAAVHCRSVRQAAARPTARGG